MNGFYEVEVFNWEENKQKKINLKTTPIFIPLKKTKQKIMKKFVNSELIIGCWQEQDGT